MLYLTLPYPCLALRPLDGGLLRPRRGLAASVSDTVALYLEIFRLPKFFDHNTFQLCISYNKFTKMCTKGCVNHTSEPLRYATINILSQITYYPTLCLLALSVPSSLAVVCARSS